MEIKMRPAPVQQPALRRVCSWIIQGACTSAYFHAFDISTSVGKAVTKKVFQLVCKYMGEYVDYWIIGNEVNDSHVYYESGTDDLNSFVRNYEAAMRLMYDVSAELITMSDEQQQIADVNDDGVVDSLDAILILRYDAGLINSF